MAKRPTSTNNDDDEDNGEVRIVMRGLDPLVRALLKHLPPTKSVWSPADRQKWMAMLTDAFNVIYKDAPDPPKAGSSSGTGQHP
jgi:hypothetical protein